MINPYNNINWNTVIQIPSVSHVHCTGQATFNRLVNGGIRYAPLSNYHPSKPWYPLSDYFTVPEGIIGSPNAEFYNMDIRNFHANGLGSLYEEPEPNTQKTWKYKFNRILEDMQYEDAGGITLNHPHWTKDQGEELKNSDLIEMLDYDSRVLGIEFYNATCERLFDNGWDLNTWDSILLTGRRCWGFCVPDHDAEVSDEGFIWEGRNILLVSEFTEYECLKAYREGRFYGALRNTELTFESISYSNGVLSVVTSNADYIDFVVNGSYNRVNGISATYNVPSNAVYVRVEASNSENTIYSQAITLKQYKNNDNTAKKMLILGL